MSKNLESKNIEELLAEADELLGQIDSDLISEMEEEHRLQLEIHAQNLEKIKSEVHDETEKKKAPDAGYGAEGMHEAVVEIVKAMRGLKKLFS
jgi:regulator of replication initiation timing